jgi:hypothetical protein
MENQIDKIAVVENDFVGNGLKPPFQMINEYVRGCPYKGSLFI